MSETEEKSGPPLPVSLDHQQMDEGQQRLLHELLSLPTKSFRERIAAFPKKLRRALQEARNRQREAAKVQETAISPSISQALNRYHQSIQPVHQSAIRANLTAVALVRVLEQKGVLKPSEVDEEIQKILKEQEAAAVDKAEGKE